MNAKTTFLVIAALFMGLIVLDGCKKSEPPPAPKPSGTMQGQQPAATTTKPASGTAVAAEQTTCPVTGRPIDKSIFVEYNGKKVYFCTPDCKAKFLKDPEKYVAKLPQFQK
jgi:YHS domain-containing protein